MWNCEKGRIENHVAPELWGGRKIESAVLSILFFIISLCVPMYFIPWKDFPQEYWNFSRFFFFGILTKSGWHQLNIRNNDRTQWMQGPSTRLCRYCRYTADHESEQPNMNPNSRLDIRTADQTFLATVQAVQIADIADMKAVERWLDCAPNLSALAWPRALGHYFADIFRSSIS